jgi:phosphatidylglycerol:prolipoprotein diacylglycerol transferase
VNTILLKSVSFPGLGLDFDLNPTMFQIGSVRITWYGFLIAIGMLLAMAFAYWKAPSFGVNRDKLMDAGIGGIIGGIIGARAYFVIFSWENYKDDLLSIFKTWNGGMAIYGGLIGGLLVGLLIAKIRKIKIFPAIDLACMGFLIGQSIGRWGNFVNVEAFGGNTELPWGMTGPSITSYLQEHYSELNALGMDINPQSPVHPCFLYESLWCILGFVLLFLYMKHRKFDGEIFLMYSAWYGAGRFVIEGLRTDSLLIGNIRVSQLLAGILVVASVIVWIVVRGRIRARHDPEYLMLYVNTPAWKQECEEEAEKLRLYQEKRAARKGVKPVNPESATEVVEIEDYPAEKQPETEENTPKEAESESDHNTEEK